MATPQPIPLTAVRTVPGEPEYQALLGWPFAAQPFYEGQVIRLLQNDIPHRVMYSFGLVWYYRDPDGNTVGFGTLDVCNEYERFTGGKFHSYIPLLAVNPAFQKRGHGRSIVQHLIGEAVLIAQSPAGVSDLLFLDIYVANQGAISLYEKCGFVTLNPDTPIPEGAVTVSGGARISRGTRCMAFDEASGIPRLERPYTQNQLLHPIPDTQENNEPYVIMAKKVSVDSG